MIEAKIIADSVSPDGHRLTTMQVTGHRFILAEFNTHRVFSRNSASSRAIPLRKQLQRVMEDPALPVKWPLEQAGMQGGDEIDDPINAEAMWFGARDYARTHALGLAALGVHKSIANRLLEPFMWHTIVVTSTAWENFFRQRCSPLAQPEIRALAEQMREAYDASDPHPIAEGRWHLPYLYDEDYAELSPEERPKVSAARCARVSYLTQEGTRDFSKDLELYDRLVSADPMHASPLEHVATPCAENAHVVSLRRGDPVIGPLPKIGNLLGWRQLRLDVELEKGWVSFS